MQKLLGCAALLVLTLSGSTQDNDWLIVPGRRVGPITPATTRSDLPRLFGPKNVRDHEIVTSDMASEYGTEIFPDKPDMSLAIFWATEVTDSRIRRIRFCPSLILPGKCRWHTAEGITLGTSLKDLERLNSRPFQLHGFDWGFGGLITSWDSGRLDKLAANCGFTIRLDPAPGPASDQRAQLIDAVEGDEEFASSVAAMQALNPVIDFLSLSFQTCK